MKIVRAVSTNINLFIEVGPVNYVQHVSGYSGRQRPLTIHLQDQHHFQKLKDRLRCWTQHFLPSDLQLSSAFGHSYAYPVFEILRQQQHHQKNVPESFYPTRLLCVNRSEILRLFHELKSLFYLVLVFVTLQYFLCGFRFCQTRY